MKILSAVYNEIDYDGRVQRAAEALSAVGDVVVVNVDSGRGYRNARFGVVSVRLPGRWRRKELSHLCFWISLWCTAVRWRPNIVHAHDFFMAFPGWVAAKLAGARLVYDAHELIIPDPAISQSRRDRFWYLLERWVVRRTDLVIAANEERARLMAQHYGLKSLPQVIRNIPPLPKQKMTDNEIQQIYPQLKRKTPHEYLLVYQGDMSLERGVGDFVRAFKQLEGNGFRLVLVGSGPDLEKLRTGVRNEGLEETVSFTDKVPRDHLYDMLRQCDIGIVTYPDRGLNNLYCAPNKVFEYAQSGLAIFCYSNPVLDDLLKRYPIGISIARGDDIARHLHEMSQGLDRFKSALRALLREASWDEEAARIRARFLRI